MKTPERRQWRHSGIFIVNFEQISHCPGISIVEVEQINADWDYRDCKFKDNVHKYILLATFQFIKTVTDLINP